MERGKEDFQGEVDGAGYKVSMDDPNKVPLTLVWPGFVAGIARVLRFGARKYARGNWMRGMSFSEVLDAMKRHIAKIELGEDIDPETGESHLYHLGCDAMFLSYYQNGERSAEYAAFDDRLYRYKTPPPPKELAQQDVEVACVTTRNRFFVESLKHCDPYNFFVCGVPSCPACSLVPK
jgi:dATP/dGTP diphosphohydrolase